MAKNRETRLNALEHKQQALNTVAAKLRLLDSTDEDIRMNAASEIIAYVHSKVPAVATDPRAHDEHDPGRILEPLAELGVLPPRPFELFDDPETE